MSRRYVIKLEIAVAIVLALIGAFFIYLASSIPQALNDPIGPKVLPMFLAISLVAGGALVAILALVKHGPGTPDEVDMKSSYGFRESNVPLIFAVIGCGIVYLISFWAFGYFVATFIAVVLIMLTFGNRNWLLILVISLVAAMVYQFVFMGLMGLFDPPGNITDLRQYTNWMTGAK